jgi:hypothetical protein
MQHNDIQRNGEHCYAECHIQTLYAECHYAKCRYAEWGYAECRSAV